MDREMDREDVKREINQNKINHQYDEKSFVLAYFYDKVCIGKIKNSQIVFNNEVNYDFLTQIRIFNEKQEIRYVLDETTNKFQKTIINDDKSEFFIDENMYIIGNKEISRNDDFVTIKQDGGNIDIPIDETFNINQEDISKGLRLKLRNYYKEDENNQLVFANSRLVEIGKGEE